MTLYPFQWKTVTLSQTCQLGKNKTINPLKYPDEVFEYYSIPAFQERGAPINEYGAHILSNKILVENKTVLFGKLNPRVLKVWLVESASPLRKIATTEFLPILAKDCALPEYLFFLCHSGLVVQEAKRLVSGSTPSRERVDPTAFYQITIPLPPLPEQRAIAHALRAVQDARDARRYELEVERERKAALMEDLFTCGTRGEAQKETDIGLLPQSWRCTMLGEICDGANGFIQTGPFGSQLHASDYKPTGVPAVNPTHLGLNTIHEANLPRISSEDADRLSRHYIKAGDILISRRGDFSKYSYIAPRHAGWLCGTGCILIRLRNPKIDNLFVALSFSTRAVQAYLQQASVGSIMPNLNTRILCGVRFALPPLDEQQDIAEILTACDQKIAALESEVALHEELFRALLDELMTGRLSALPLAE